MSVYNTLSSYGADKTSIWNSLTPSEQRYYSVLIPKLADEGFIAPKLASVEPLQSALSSSVSGEVASLAKNNPNLFGEMYSQLSGADQVRVDSVLADTYEHDALSGVGLDSLNNSKFGSGYTISPEGNITSDYIQSKMMSPVSNDMVESAMIHADIAENPSKYSYASEYSAIDKDNGLLPEYDFGPSISKSSVVGRPGGVGNYATLTNPDGSTIGVSESAYSAMEDTAAPGYKLEVNKTLGEESSTDGITGAEWGELGLGVGQLGLGVMSYLENQKTADKQRKLLDQQIKNNREEMAHRKKARAAATSAFANA